MTKRMAHFGMQGLFLFVLFVVISACGALSPGMTDVAATQHENVTLPCYIFNQTDQGVCYRLRWTKYVSDTYQKKVVLAWPKAPKIQDEERAKWGTDGHSLFLTKLNVSDEGKYSCEICKGWDCEHVDINLKIKQCKVLETRKASPGTSVKLTCPVNMTSAEKQGATDISWFMVKGNPVNITSKTAEKNGALLIFKSVSRNDSGWYKCIHMLGKTQHCYDFKLQVEEVAVTTTSPALKTEEISLETREEGSDGAFIAVIVASVIIGTAIVTAALVLLILYRRRNTQRPAQYTQGPPTDAGVQPNCDYEDVSLPHFEDFLTQRVNSLYHQDDSLCTFQY